MAAEKTNTMQLILKTDYGSVRSGGYLFIRNTPVTVDEEDANILLERYPDSLEVYVPNKKTRANTTKKKRITGNVFKNSERQ